MTISEMEQRSGMERGNIRFYEKEGLLCPKRLINGYRDYSEEDLALLLRIKLLRSLDVSLEEIRALQRGEESLSAVLERQHIALGQAEQRFFAAQRLCQRIRETERDFASLDAEKYLSPLYEEENRFLSAPNDRIPPLNKPWRRYFARFFDLVFYEFLFKLFLTLGFSVNITDLSPMEELGLGLVALFLMLFLEPLFLHLYGATPGKALLGLELKNPVGDPLSYGEALVRSWKVLTEGMGLSIPIYAQIRLYKNYDACKKGEPLPWEGIYSYSCKEKYFPLRILGFFLAFGLILFSTALSVRIAERPPHRGELTVAEFSENYNFYARYFELDSRLAPDGTLEGEWKDLFLAPPPEIRFELSGSHIRSLEIREEQKAPRSHINAHTEHLLLCALAFTGAQEELSLFSELPSTLCAVIAENPFTGYRFPIGELEVLYEVSYRGLIDSGTGLLLPEQLLRPEAAEEESDYRMRFFIGQKGL